METEDTEQGFISVELLAVLVFLCALVILLALIVPGFDL